jgi:hypothetical protein
MSRPKEPLTSRPGQNPQKGAPTGMKKKSPSKKKPTLSKGTKMAKTGGKMKKPKTGAKGSKSAKAPKMKGAQVANKSHLLKPQATAWEHDAESPQPKQVANKSHLLKPQTA